MSEIDVSKCDDFAIRNTENSDKKLYWCHRYDDYCNDFPNCDYKQLQQLKQEILEEINPILDITTIDRCFGAEYQADYVLAKRIKQIIEKG